MLLFACKKEKLEVLKPYIYFADNIDYYVIDTDTPPSSYSIRGSMSAEAYITEVKMGDIVLDKDTIGALQSRFMINLPVSINNPDQPFDVNFSCTDGNMETGTNVFHFLTSKPIDTYIVTLGAQTNSNYGFYFSFKDHKVYSVSEFKNIKDDDEGFCYGYDRSNEEPMFLSPTELISNNILDIKGSKVSSFCGIVAVNNQTFTKALFDGIHNDAFIRNLNGADYRTFAYSSIGEGKSYLVKSPGGLRGIVYVQNVQKGIAGSTDLIIKLQRQ